MVRDSHTHIDKDKYIYIYTPIIRISKGWMTIPLSDLQALAHGSTFPPSLESYLGVSKKTWPAFDEGRGSTQHKNIGTG